MQPEPTVAAELTGAPKSGAVLLRGGLIADVRAHRVIRRDVLIDEGRIHEIVAPDDERKVGTVVDIRGCVVLPGLINAHSHSYAPLVRHIGQGLPLEPWMMYCWAKHHREDAGRDVPKCHPSRHRSSQDRNDHHARPPRW